MEVVHTVFTNDNNMKLREKIPGDHHHKQLQLESDNGLLFKRCPNSLESHPLSTL